MFIELDPGTAAAPAMAKDGTIRVQNTAPDIDPDEILSALDTDTRSYLQLLINGAGQRPARSLHRPAQRLQAARARRTRTWRACRRRSPSGAYEPEARLVHNYGQLTATLADKDHQITTLVDAGNAVLQSFANENQNISTAVAKLPGALNQTQSTLSKVTRWRACSGRAQLAAPGCAQAQHRQPPGAAVREGGGADHRATRSARSSPRRART